MTRAHRDELLAACGFPNVKDIRELSFLAAGIKATVFATDARGRLFADGDEIAVHEVFIPFTG
jgi:hypothetical protein